MDRAASSSLTIPSEEPLGLALAIVRELSAAFGAVVESVDIDEESEGEIILRIQRS